MKRNSAMKIMMCMNIIGFLVLGAFFSFPLTWDAAVYIGMGKAIASLGKKGIWEASRPLIWPLVLGIAWKSGADLQFSSRMISLLVSVGCIFMIYIIGREIFDKKVALLASFLFAFTPIIIQTGSSALTGMPSTFFGLIAFYSFIKKRYYTAGFFCGMAFMTRFLQLLIFAAFLFALFSSKEREKLKKYIKIISGFSIIVVPYFILNYILYRNLFYPFLTQLLLTKYTGWIWWEPWYFYITNLLKQNFLIIMVLPACFLLFKKKDWKIFSVFIVFFLFFVFFSLTKHKELRFVIVFLPYLYLLCGYGLLSYLGKIRKWERAILFTVMVLWLVQIIPLLGRYTENENLLPYTSYLESIKENNKIWISNPKFILGPDKKAELIYYPIFSTQRIEQLETDILDAEQILLRTCDLHCFPDDNKCPEAKERFIAGLKEDLKIVYEEKTVNCEGYIFSSNV